MFGRAERDLLEPALFSYTARNASRAWFNLTSDMSSVIVTLIFYEWLTGKDTGILQLIGDTTGTAYDWLITGWRNYRDSDAYAAEYYERAHSPFGGLHNMWDNFIDVFSGATIERMNESRE